MQQTELVEEYIARAPQAVQGKLRELRQLLKAIAPEATERISYGMPSYHEQGPIVYFAPAKRHIGLYIPPPVIEQHAADLKGYVTTKSAVHLSRERPLPVSLIKKLVKARMKVNSSRSR